LEVSPPFTLPELFAASEIQEGGARAIDAGLRRTYGIAILEARVVSQRHIATRDYMRTHADDAQREIGIALTATASRSTSAVSQHPRIKSNATGWHCS
jgi:hypothetical protein